MAHGWLGPRLGAGWRWEKGKNLINSLTFGIGPWSESPATASRDRGVGSPFSNYIFTHNPSDTNLQSAKADPIVHLSPFAQYFTSVFMGFCLYKTLFLSF